MSTFYNRISPNGFNDPSQNTAFRTNLHEINKMESGLVTTKKELVGHQEKKYFCIRHVLLYIL